MAPQQGESDGGGNREWWAAFDPFDGGKPALIEIIGQIRDTVLQHANLLAGERVLDLGGGTGLLTLEARRRVGPTGLVATVDLSQGALQVCRAQATADGTGGRLAPVVGAAVHLPFAAASFDVALVRSVLMYVADRPQAARELRRILRPRGRVSIYEPINRHTRRLGQVEDWQATLDLSSFEPAHSQIAGYLERQRGPDWAQQYRGPGWPVVRNFDERDLLRAFADAGFREVELCFRQRSTAVTDVAVQARYAAAARTVLGDSAEAYLTRLQQQRPRMVQRNAFAEAYLTARC